MSSSQSKIAKYALLQKQVRALFDGEPDPIANQANFLAAIQEQFKFHWIGFYWVKDSQLVLGPFQGPVACTRIPFHAGVCGHAYTTQSTVIVKNVHEFKGHIACSSLSQSEIVIPIRNRLGNIVGVLDVDSEFLNFFQSEDQDGLESLVKILESALTI